MPLMTIANNDSRIMIERVAAGSPPVTGHFHLRFQDNSIADIPVNSTGEQMKELLENGFSDQEVLLLLAQVAVLDTSG